MGPLRDPQLFLYLLQRHALGLRNHRLHPNKLQDHHAGKERENVTWGEGGDHPREERGEQRGEDPVREAAESLALCTMAIGKYLGDEYPDHRALANGVGGDESEDADRDDRIMIGKECPGYEPERGDVTERADIEKRAPAEAIDQPEADERENQIGDADADGLQQRGLSAEAG